jgi:thymidylate synthase (FAD)
VVSEYSEEWKWIADNYFVPSCKTRGYCIEAQCCGAAPKGLKGLQEKNITDFVKYLSENTTADITTIKDSISSFLEESK